MDIYAEDITEDYGDHGVRVYSLVHGMDFYYAEIRASGISLYDAEGFGKGEELDEDDEMVQILGDAILTGNLKGEIE